MKFPFAQLVLASTLNPKRLGLSSEEGYSLARGDAPAGGGAEGLRVLGLGLGVGGLGFWVLAFGVWGLEFRV